MNGEGQISKASMAGWVLLCLVLGFTVAWGVAFQCLPVGVAYRHSTAHHPCDWGYKQIDGAKATWALECRKTPGDLPTEADLCGPDKYLREKPSCRAGGTYILGAVGEEVTCTIPDHTLWRLGILRQASATPTQPDVAASQCFCRDNLKLIDAAKKYWAQEGKRPAGERVGDEDLFAPKTFRRKGHNASRLYILFNVEFQKPVYERLTIAKPVCPAGGTYLLGAVGTLPVCSVPGHSL